MLQNMNIVILCSTRGIFM